MPFAYSLSLIYEITVFSKNAINRVSPSLYHNNTFKACTYYSILTYFSNTFFHILWIFSLLFQDSPFASRLCFLYCIILIHFQLYKFPTKTVCFLFTARNTVFLYFNILSDFLINKIWRRYLSGIFASCCLFILSIHDFRFCKILKLRT